jgi:hypothetical protein
LCRLCGPGLQYCAARQQCAFSSRPDAYQDSADGTIAGSYECCIRNKICFIKKKDPPESAGQDQCQSEDALSGGSFSSRGLDSTVTSLGLLFAPGPNHRPYSMFPARVPNTSKGCFSTESTEIQMPGQLVLVCYCHLAQVRQHLVMPAWATGIVLPRSEVYLSHRSAFDIMFKLIK